MEPSLIWAIIATIGAFTLPPIAWIISGTRIKKAYALSMAQHKETQEGTRNVIEELQNIRYAVEKHPPNTPAEQNAIITTAQSIIHSLSGSINATSKVGGSLDINGTAGSTIKPKPSAGPGPEDEYTP